MNVDSALSAICLQLLYSLLHITLTPPHLHLVLHIQVFIHSDSGPGCILTGRGWWVQLGGVSRVHLGLGAGYFMDLRPSHVVNQMRLGSHQLVDRVAFGSE